MMTMPPLFCDAAIAPSTEGIKYTGSKLRLLPHILQLARKVTAGTILDGFSGTTRVSQAFARSGYCVLCNDASVWSEVFGHCYLLAEKPRAEYDELIRHLNSLRPADGWFTQNYGGLPNGGSAVQSDGLKRPWQIHNTRKLDAIREEIESLRLSQAEKSVALTSLILALDRVDNTLGHYASYLRSWAPRAYGNLTLKIPDICGHGKAHRVFRRDIFDMAREEYADIAYFDPPYGSNNDKMPASRVRYSAYYHLWTTVCLNDNPPLFGKALRRKDSADPLASSVFEDFRKNDDGEFVVTDALKELIRIVRAQWIILSYSSHGRADLDALTRILTENGKILKTVSVDYKKNVMSDMTWTNQWVRDCNNPTREFLFLVEKK